MDNPQPTVLQYQSQWRSLRLGLAGWVILVIGAVGLLHLVRYYFTFEEDFHPWNFWAYFIVAQQLLILGAGFHLIWRSYLPSQWKTELKLHLTEKKLELIHAGKTEVLPFERIDCIVFKAVSPIFTTHYLYWAEVGTERIPMLAFSKVHESNDFFTLLIRQAGLKVEQAPSSP